MSVIETAPKDRLAIHTSILKFGDEAVAAAIRQELGRDGQAFFVHDRVDSIDALARRVTQLVPDARITVAHGQMPEAELERRMLAFVEGRIDVLVATTIVENGLDIPRANTILVNRADHFGLAQLYQLRGRVGRSDRRAYAYLLVPAQGGLSELARKRLAAIQEFSELGAGFRIAALDLELRGAGNLLGGEQSGQIEAVGLDLYIKLLEQQVLELRGQGQRLRPRAALNLRLDLGIPEDYVADVQQRMSLYKRLAEARRREEHDALAREIEDRNGPMPRRVAELLRYATLRLRAEDLGVAQVERSGEVLALRFVAETTLAPAALVALVERTRGAALAPDGTVRVPTAGDPLRALHETLAALEDAQPEPAAP
jgi:transcription-repair coupling factor (superfamily II helicase)